MISRKGEENKQLGKVKYYENRGTCLREPSWWLMIFSISKYAPQTILTVIFIYWNHSS